MFIGNRFTDSKHPSTPDGNTVAWTCNFIDFPFQFRERNDVKLDIWLINVQDMKQIMNLLNDSMGSIRRSSNGSYRTSKGKDG